ncbi:MAG: flippase [bacterium]|nr:flippase [bacterium]
MKNNLVKSVFWVTVSEILFNLSGYVIHSVAGRVLGPGDYGRYGIVITLTTMIIILVGNGVPTAMAKYLSEVFESNPIMIGVIKKKAIILQSIIIGTLTVIFFLLAPVLAWALKDPTLTNLFRLSTLIIPAFAMSSFYFSYYTGLHKFNIQSLLKTLRSLFRVTIIVALAYFYKVPGAILGYVIAPFLTFIIGWCIDKFRVKAEIENQIQLNPNKAEIVFEYKKLMRYAWQIVIFFLAYELFISIDLYLVKGILRNDYLTGIYNGALTVGRIPYYVFYALTVVLLPAISKSTSENNHAKTSQIIGNSLRLMLIILAPAIILMAYFSQPIIKIFYSARYLAAAEPMAVLVYGVGFLTIFYVMSFVMNGAGKTKIPMIISIIGLTLNSVLNYFFIQKFGLMGSAWATTISSFLAMLLMVYFLYREFGVVISIKSLLRVIFSSGGLYLTSTLFPNENYYFIIWSIILLSFYFIFLYILGEIKKDDISYFRNIILKKK